MFIPRFEKSAIKTLIILFFLFKTTVNCQLTVDSCHVAHSQQINFNFKTVSALLSNFGKTFFCEIIKKGICKRNKLFCRFVYIFVALGL